jgi:hypothetical protein
MGHKLDFAERRRIYDERLATERLAFPSAAIEVIVEEYTYANGDAIIRVVRGGGNAKPE